MNTYRLMAQLTPNGAPRAVSINADSAVLAYAALKQAYPSACGVRVLSAVYAKGE